MKIKIELPQKNQVEKFGSAIDAKLLKELHSVCKSKGIKLRQAIEYGVKRFLEDVKKTG
jgi:hypothetical protein